MLQTNDASIFWEELNVIVTVAHNRSGGGICLRLGNMLYDDILSRKGKHLYNLQSNDSNLCFCASYTLSMVVCLRIKNYSMQNSYTAMQDSN